MFSRLIAPKWLTEKDPSLPRAFEGDYTDEELHILNDQGYNVYFLPNHPKEYPQNSTVDGSLVDTFNFVFVDMDLKDGMYATKQDFLIALSTTGIKPTMIIDSGNGIHAYWAVSDLDAKSYLRLSRRFMRMFRTDEAVGQLFQLMRLPGFNNTKDPNNLKPCQILETNEVSYTCEELNKLLPPISPKDEEYCEQHYNKTYGINQETINISDELPPKFGKLINENLEAKELFAGQTGDRSKADYRLAHIMFANGFTKEEAASVLVNSVKALDRAPKHRVSYATNIIDKIWTYELDPKASDLTLSSSVKDILGRSGDTVKGTPFRCHKRIDNTEYGFRLGQVLGLVAGSGVGKTAFAMNMFKWFCEQNPDYHHFFIPLEQPSNEIADRWSTMCQGDTTLHDKVHIMSNYDDEGGFRHLSLTEIKDYIMKWQDQTGKKVGCVVIDHIGALKKKGSNDENQDLITICHSMKAFAIETKTFLIMQSQTSREKAGIGDLELNKDAAYGTLFFESYCDYLITLWQPLKRMHAQESCPTVTAFKFCKIRHKKAKRDVIKEDVPYYFSFDSETELLKDMTQDEKTAFDYWLPQATKKRNNDRKTEILTYQSVPYEGSTSAEQADTNSNRQLIRH
jgi:hypothetical protein